MSFIKFKKRITLIATLSVAPLMVAGGGSVLADSGSITINYASPNPESDPTQKAITWFMDEVTERTEGRVKFNVFLGNSLVKDQDVLGAVGDGMVDMAKIFTISYPGQMPLWNIGNLPFTHPDPSVLQSTLHELSEKHSPFIDEMTKLNVYPLGLIATGGTQVVSKVPLKGLEDIDGLKVRARGVQAAAFSAAGANPVSIPWNDTYDALSKGVVDATTTYLLSVRSARHHEVGEYYVSVDLGQAVQMEIINKDFWEGLPEDIRNLLTNVMREAEERYGEKAAELAISERESLAGTGIEQLRFSRFSEPEVEKWKSISPDFFGNWAGENQQYGDTEEIVKDFFDIQEKYAEQAEENGNTGIW